MSRSTFWSSREISLSIFAKCPSMSAIAREAARFFLASSRLDQSVIQFFKNHMAIPTPAPHPCAQKHGHALGVPNRAH